MDFIEDINLDNKKVILRLDLNVTIKDGEILDDTRIRKSIPTIKYLLKHGCHILIMSHLGKIKTVDDLKNNSLLPVCQKLSDLLGKKIIFIAKTRSDKIKNELDSNELVMLENTRYEDLIDKRESSCDEELSKYWASLGDVFINDAFGTTHRRHASNAGISKYLKSGYGFLIKEELMGLDPIVNNIDHPFTVIMGGAKVDDKVLLIESLLERCDYLLVGGGIANTFLKASEIDVGNSLYSKEYVSKVGSLIYKYKDKIKLPIDVIVEENDEVKEINLNEINKQSIIYDLGSKTIESYKEIIDKSKTIFVNGTMGLYEDERFRKGTEELYKLFNPQDKNIIAGGGDALASINKLGYENSFDFLSTGGGATLDYIANKNLACFKEE